jgi:hypothetical protein
VTIVSANAETADGLRSYLCGAGVEATSTAELSMPHEGALDAAVYFPDEYGAEEALEVIQKLRRAHSGLLVVIVTRQPHTFVRALDDDEGGRAPIVIPKPAWGWTILDAIREQLAL